MSSPAFRRIFMLSARRNVQRTSTNLRFGLRRNMASSAGPEKSNDTAWLIGTGAVTIIGAAYILSPRSKKHAHEAAKAAEAPIEMALPKTQKEEKQSEPELMKDDEGREEDVSESMKKGYETDNPKDAKAAEKDAARFDEGAPGQTDDAENLEVKERPKETQRAGTLQDKSQEGPTNIGDARQQAKEKKAPKEVAENSDS